MEVRTNHERASVQKRSVESIEQWQITAASFGPTLPTSQTGETTYSTQTGRIFSHRSGAMDKIEHPTSTTALRIVASKEEDGPSSTAYKGQYRRWPGVVLLVAIVALASVLITTKARDAYDASVERAAEFEMYKQSGRRIKDGTTAEGDIISDDGQIGNPKQYDTSSDCALPDYQSKNGRLYAVSSNGTEVPFRVKGVNWFGMETDLAVPFGLWENQMNGTTAYEVAAFLSRNKFNAVRIPISIENVLNNNAPKEGVVNKASNRALNLKNYITTLQSIVQSLAFRRIGVLISMHRLTNTKAGANWFDEALGVSQEDFLKAVSIISKELCGQEYWNVMGLDLKNEPEKAEWGTGTDADFVTGAEKIAKVMHDNCPNWLGFVEGVVDERSMTLDGKEITYYDWWGGGLQDAAKSRPKFKIENKLVWAPHYYTTAVAPQSYFYGDKTTADYSTYEELGDEDLYKRVEGTMHHMFGYLVEENAYALLLGEFAGLYSKDAHPMKTTKRTTDMTIRVMMSKNYAGGFMWSLNPESAYEYNPADTKGSFTEGLLSDDWLTPDKEFLNAFVPMDSMPDLRQLPCFEPTKKSS